MDTHKNIPWAVSEISNSTEICTMQQRVSCKCHFDTYNVSSYNLHLNNTSVFLKLAQENELCTGLTLLP